MREKQLADLRERDADPCMNFNKTELGIRGAQFLVSVASQS